MSSVVVKNQGDLIQSEVNIADALVLVQASQTPLGWTGGLRIVRDLLRLASSKFIFSYSNLGERLTFEDTNVLILTQDRQQPIEILDASSAFGGEESTQVIGATLCALAHELAGATAVRLFVDHLARNIFKGPNELVDALGRELMDTSTITRILNEGAARGLTKLFNSYVASLKLPPASAVPPPRESRSGPPTLSLETQMLAGFLRWLGESSSAFRPYFTRSGLVARTAAYLQQINYQIGQIIPWSGEGGRPPNVGPRSVILVLGGSWPTDEYITEVEIADELPYLSHFTFKTLGGVLYNALKCRVCQSPESFQVYFDEVFHKISQDLALRVHWVVGSRQERGESRPGRGIYAMFKWQIPKKSAKSSAKILAAQYFPTSSELFGHCYELIDPTGDGGGVNTSERGKDAVLEGELSLEIARFRVITASIVIAIISRLAPDDFDIMRHATRLDLSNDTWIKSICQTLDHRVKTEMSLEEAVWMLATVHAGEAASKSSTELSLDRVIGWRYGDYTVLPTLLLQMQPTPDAVGLTCKDQFIANLFAHEDGSIRDIEALSVSRNQWEAPESTTTEIAARPLENNPWFGNSNFRPPDSGLYLNIERPTHYSRVDTCFSGRVDGAIMGTVSIRHVMETILHSSNEPLDCNHTGELCVLNIEVSYWMALKRKLVKPSGTIEEPAYLIAKDHKQWALLLAGQATGPNSRIVYRCATCAFDKAKENAPKVEATLIGYKG